MKLYVFNQDVLAQNAETGAINYTIDIGWYDKLSVMEGRNNFGLAYVAKRDWLTLNYKLQNKNEEGVWTIQDGFSSYNYTNYGYNLNSVYPNV